MSHYYFDSSAIVKRYVEEESTGWVITTLQSENSILISAITGVEVVATLARKLRIKQITKQQYQTAYQSFEYDYDNLYLKRDVDNTVISLAMYLAQQHPLKGYDSIQLSSAIVLNNRLEQKGFSNLTLVCADKTLNVAAEKEGFVIINPKDD